MIQADDFILAAKALGFRTWAGVPCSFLTPLVNRVIDDPQMNYIASANEGDAVATASGVAMTGQPAVAMMQNSGLGNAVSPLSSLNWVFRIPVLLIVTLRGEPGSSDEPQHELMGQITTGMLDQLEVPWSWFPRHSQEVASTLAGACRRMEESGLPFALVMRKGSVAASTLDSCWQPTARPQPSPADFSQAKTAVLSRRQALEAVIETTPENSSVVIGSTGYIGRELFSLADRPNQLYMVGSMGCASSFALGLSLAMPKLRVVAVEGDGAALMRLGNFATVGAYAGENFCHLLLDNHMHESTGGQPTVSRAVSFAAVASACGYRIARAGGSLDSLGTFMRLSDGPAFMQLLISQGAPTDLPRPKLTPQQVKSRLIAHLGLSPSRFGNRKR